MVFFHSLRLHYAPLVSRYAQLYAGSPSAPKPYREQVMERLDRLLQSNGLTAYKPLSGQHTSPSPDNAKKTPNNVRCSWLSIFNDSHPP